MPKVVKRKLTHKSSNHSKVVRKKLSSKRPKVARKKSSKQKVARKKLSSKRPKVARKRKSSKRSKKKIKQSGGEISLDTKRKSHTMIVEKYKAYLMTQLHTTNYKTILQTKNFKNCKVLLKTALSMFVTKQMGELSKKLAQLVRQPQKKPQTNLVIEILNDRKVFFNRIKTDVASINVDNDSETLPVFLKQLYNKYNQDIVALYQVHTPPINDETLILRWEELTGQKYTEPDLDL